MWEYLNNRKVEVITDNIRKCQWESKMWVMFSILKGKEILKKPILIIKGD